MRSPLSLAGSLYNFRNAIRSIIPQNTNTIVFANSRDLELEFYLSSKFNIVANTLDYRVEDFWGAYLSEPHRVFSIAKDLAATIDLEEYNLLIELYIQSRDEVMRAALVLLMNRCGQRLDLFKDTFDPVNATSLTDFLDKHKHFLLRDFSVKTATLTQSFGNSRSFVVLDLPRPKHQKTVPISMDNGFTSQDLVSFLVDNNSWCIVMDRKHTPRNMLEDFEHFNINSRGYRTEQETNKILFYKT
tara:strand:- start:457 stop:1188 length:732 start_codon:yes stop_codon:yes gene_type:complete